MVNPKYFQIKQNTNKEYMGQRRSLERNLKMFLNKLKLLDKLKIVLRRKFIALHALLEEKKFL